MTDKKKYPNEVKSTQTKKIVSDSQQLCERCQDQRYIEVQLRERIKELNCLYGLTRLVEQHEDSIDKLLQEVADSLPASWQHQDIACARIEFKGYTYCSNNFKSTQWNQKAPIVIAGRQEGGVEVHYLRKRPRLDEGPFMSEERLLINAVSELLAKAIERIRTQRQLKIERQALQDANVALHESLVQSKREKMMVGASIQAKIDKIITPIFYALESGLETQQMKYLDLLKKNLTDIVAPFVEGGQDILAKLSPTEVTICNMIKHGLSSKEIAKLKGVSPATVNRQRDSIRSKLGLTNRKINLVSYLNSRVE